MTTPITTRVGKGSRLSFTEMDANFTNLKSTADAAAVQATTYLKSEVDSALATKQATIGFTPVNANTIGAASGLATLDATGKLTTAQIPTSLVGAVVYQGVWNASTNSPVLTSGTGNKGYYYKVSATGSTVINGISQWNIGDVIIFNGTTWDKIDGVASEVVTVAGRTGAVVLTVADISGAAPILNPTFSGIATANSFAGAGTGLTGTATGLSIGGNAATATAVAFTGISGKPTTLAGYGITDMPSSFNGGTVTGSSTFTGGLVSSKGIKFVTPVGVILQNAVTASYASVPNDYIKLVTPIKASDIQMFSIDIMGYDRFNIIDFTVAGALIYDAANLNSVASTTMDNRSGLPAEIRIALEDRGNGQVVVILMGNDTSVGFKGQSWTSPTFTTTIRGWGGQEASWTSDQFFFVTEPTLANGSWKSDNINNMYMDGTNGIIYANTVNTVQVNANFISGNGNGLTGTANGLSIGGNAATVDSISYTQILQALNFTPYSASNPSNYISTNQPIIVTGDITGTGTTELSLTLAASGVVSGTYPKVTVDTKGRVISGAALTSSDIPNLDYSKITSGKPTTLSGYGITLTSSDIPNLDYSKITSGKPTTLSGYGITDAITSTLAASTYALIPTAFSTSATGSSLSTAMAITGTYAIITVISGTGGVSLPVATSGKTIKIINKSGNITNVYPNTIATTIDSLSAGVPVVLPNSGVITLTASSTGIWYSSLNESVSASMIIGNVTTASNATTATNATNLIGGVSGAIPYQNGIGFTAFSAVGIAGQLLSSSGTGTPVWLNQSFITLQSSQVTGALGFTPASSGSNTSLSLVNGAFGSATLTTSAITVDQLVDSIAITAARSVKYLIQITSGTSYHAMEMLIIHDGVTAYATQSNDVFTGVSLASFNSTIVGGNLQLLVTPVNAVSTIKVVRTSITV